MEPTQSSMRAYCMCAPGAQACLVAQVAVPQLSLWLMAAMYTDSAHGVGAPAAGGIVSGVTLLTFFCARVFIFAVSIPQHGQCCTEL